MPRRSSKPKDHDFATVARNVVEQAIGEKLNGDPLGKNPAAVELGRLGGAKGGKARAEALSPRKRKQIAKKAAAARWGVKKKAAPEKRAAAKRGRERRRSRTASGQSATGGEEKGGANEAGRGEAEPAAAKGAVKQNPKSAEKGPLPGPFEGRAMQTHFGETPESIEFFRRNQEFDPAFDHLVALSNKAFGREYEFGSRAQQVCFHLGQACRLDFAEILFLAVHGFGSGADKLVRGLYERAVAMAYIAKHPAKAERFIRYGAIQEYKAMVAALELASEEQFDAVMAPTTTAAQIRIYRNEVKPEFEVELCGECKRRGTASSWDQNHSCPN